jgi:hypothetical protein
MMSAHDVISEVTNWKGVMVSAGLATPVSRAFTAFALTSALMYATKSPSSAFTPDGQMRPYSALTHDPEATTAHFFLTPSLIAGGVWLFT